MQLLVLATRQRAYKVYGLQLVVNKVLGFMIIDKKLLDDLSAKAKASSRLRQAFDLRNTPEYNSQQMLNRRTKQAQRQSSL